MDDITELTQAAAGFVTTSPLGKRPLVSPYLDAPLDSESHAGKVREVVNAILADLVARAQASPAQAAGAWKRIGSVVEQGAALVAAVRGVRKRGMGGVGPFLMDNDESEEVGAAPMTLASTTLASTTASAETFGVHSLNEILALSRRQTNVRQLASLTAAYRDVKAAKDDELAEQIREMIRRELGQEDMPGASAAGCPSGAEAFGRSPPPVAPEPGIGVDGSDEAVDGVWAYDEEFPDPEVEDDPEIEDPSTP